MCKKDVKNIFYWVKKKDLFWVVLEIEEIRDKDNATGLKEGRRNRNVNLQCFPYTRLHALSFRFFVYLLTIVSLWYILNVFQTDWLACLSGRQGWRHVWELQFLIPCVPIPLLPTTTLGLLSIFSLFFVCRLILF